MRATTKRTATMAKTHHYELDVIWTGNTGTGTSGYREYDRSHELRAEGKPSIAGTADPAFRGAPERWNPEELLVASLSQCHMLWVLALCSQDGIVVTGYADHPSGTMRQTPDGGGHFTEVLLRPVVEIADPDHAAALPDVHERAHRLCYIANSVNFDVRCEATAVVAGIS
jgi:organic hydroperoxide reductase OsmC/OhrA